MTPHKFQVLVCDDHQNSRNLLRFALEDSFNSCEITTAENGLEAEEICRDRRFDLIFLDVEMPKQDGLTTLRNLRQDLGLDTPIAICTGLGEEPEIIEKEPFLADFYLAKPLDFDEVADIVSDVVGRMRMAVA